MNSNVETAIALIPRVNAKEFNIPNDDIVKNGKKVNAAALLREAEELLLLADNYAEYCDQLWGCVHMTNFIAEGVAMKVEHGPCSEVSFNCIAYPINRSAEVKKVSKGVWSVIYYAQYGFGKPLKDVIFSRKKDAKAAAIHYVATGKITRRRKNAT